MLSTGDAEEEPQTTTDSYNFWRREATLCVISLYVEHEDDMESSTTKKKDIWNTIATKMNEAGYIFSKNKVESKWKSLVKSHKKILDNKQQTGGKRKSFQFFQKMSDILSKRHDINPPLLVGNGVTPKKTKYSTKSSTAQQKGDDSNTEGALEMDDADEVVDDVEDNDEGGELFQGTSSSTTKSAIKRRNLREKKIQSSYGNTESITRSTRTTQS